MNPNSYIPDIWALDYIIAVFYILIIYIAAFVYRSRKMETDDNYFYFLWALSIKIFGGVGFLLLTVYYWGGGDTYSYWNTANDFTAYFFESPMDGFKIFFKSASEMNWYEYKFAYNRHQFLRSTDTFTTVKITAIINMLSFRSFVVTTVVFSTLSFLGIWSMYYTFCKVYPHLRKQLFFAFFFIPSVILWGSGILKDTITISSVCLLVYSFMNIIILKRKKMPSIVLIIFSTLTIAYLKPYILYVLYPALFIWVQSNLKELIPSDLFRKLMKPFIALVLLTSSYFLAQKLSQNAGRYNVNNLERTLEGFQSWHTTVGEISEQSSYTLGDMNFSPLGILQKVPAALAVTFFRPYPFEIKNASMLLGSAEGLVLIFFTLSLILRFRMKLFRLIYKNKDVLFLLIFALIFGVVVGISSYNFGALSRYKLPSQMFFVIALVLINDKTKRLIN